MPSMKTKFVTLLAGLTFAAIPAAAQTLCLQWEVEKGAESPDFDLSLVRGREVVMSPLNPTLTIGGKVVAKNEKFAEKECVTILDFPAAMGLQVGIHHFGKSAKGVRFVELYERNADGTARVIEDFKDNFSANGKGDKSATPRAGSDYWTLISFSTALPSHVAKARAADTKGPDCTPGDGKDLTPCDFANKNHDKGDFRNTNLEGVNFHGANLKGALFNGANCKKANFKNATMEGASFTDADCPQANFKDANLKKASFKDTNLNKANFDDADIREAEFKRSKMRKVNMKKVKRDDGAKFIEVEK